MVPKDSPTADSDSSSLSLLIAASPPDCANCNISPFVFRASPYVTFMVLAKLPAPASKSLIVLTIKEKAPTNKFAGFNIPAPS